MRMLTFLIVLILASCQSSEPPEVLERGMAQIVPTQKNSHVHGIVTFLQKKDGIQIHAIIEGLPPGEHGFHIHEFGDISDEGKAAGGHYNPNHVKHGYLPKDGFENAHAGDLGNIVADKEGKANLELFVPGLTLSGGKYNIAGRAVIIHEKADDFSQPVGNAGSRIGGGTIMIVGKED